jgi:hypothetical protein
MLTVRFLEKLFPATRFVILRRDICEVAVSAILGQYSFLMGDHTLHDRSCEFSSLF